MSVLLSFRNNLFSSFLLAFIFVLVGFVQQLVEEGITSFSILLEFILIWWGFTIVLFAFRWLAEKGIARIEQHVKWEHQTIKRLLADFGLMSLQVIIVSGLVSFLMIQIVESLGTEFLKVNLWFWISMVFALVSTAWILEEVKFIQWKSHQLQLMNEQLEKEQTRSHLQSLKNQLKPHFLFNSFNVLSNLIHTNTKQADDFVIALSKVYRYVLELSEEVVVTLRKEVEFLDSFIFLQKIRFEDNLIFTNEIGNEKLQTLVPPLTLELLAENAIKHNIISKEKPLTISLKTIGDMLVVTNNYCPKKEQKDTIGKGLVNLKERLELLGTKGFEAKVEGDLFVVKVPLSFNSV